MRRLLTLLTAALCVLGLAPPAAAAPPQVVARGLVQPWATALLPDGSVLFTERESRRIWERRPGRPARVIYTVREAVARGEGGLLGIAVGPDYARDRRVHLYYTTATDNRIAYIVRGSAAVGCRRRTRTPPSRSCGSRGPRSVRSRRRSTRCSWAAGRRRCCPRTTSCGCCAACARSSVSPLMPR